MTMSIFQIYNTVYSFREKLITRKRFKLNNYELKPEIKNEELIFCNEEDEIVLKTSIRKQVVELNIYSEDIELKNFDLFRSLIKIPFGLKSYFYKGDIIDKYLIIDVNLEKIELITLIREEDLQFTNGYEVLSKGLVMPKAEDVERIIEILKIKIYSHDEYKNAFKPMRVEEYIKVYSEIINKIKEKL